MHYWFDHIYNKKKEREKLRKCVSILLKGSNVLFEYRKTNLFFSLFFSSFFFFILIVVVVALCAFCYWKELNCVLYVWLASWIASLIAFEHHIRIAKFAYLLILPFIFTANILYIYARRIITISETHTHTQAHISSRNESEL